ncbi:unnamed protein product [Malus baccata var. baccata]
MDRVRNSDHGSWNNIEAPNQAFAPPPHQTPFDTSLEDTLELLAQSTLQVQQSMSSMIQEHSTALTKLETQLGRIVQALNKQQPKEVCCTYFHSEVPEIYKDEEPYIPPKPYVLPISFPGRFVKQKHNEPPIGVLGETMQDIVFKALPLSSNLIECFSKFVTDSPCCFTSF